MRIYMIKSKSLLSICSAMLAILLLWQCFVLGENIVTASTKPINDWGLGFGKDGEQPRGNADAQTLLQYGSFYIGSADEKVLYLTFDAGFENGCTPSILDALKKHNAPATFFLVGHYVERNPELLQRMLAEGHTVGNHTYHHPDMSKIADKAAFQKELSDLEALFCAKTGQEMSKFYRPPQGKFSESNLRMAHELGYTTVFWSLAYADWLQDDQPTREEALNKLLPRTHNGAVILLHSTSQTNADILDELLTKWEEMGYRFAPLTQLQEKLLQMPSSPTPAAA